MSDKNITLRVDDVDLFLKVLGDRMYNLNHSWYYELVVKRNQVKFRISIRRNAYDNQSYIRGYKYDGEQWQCLVDKPIEQSPCAEISYVVKDRQEQYKKLFLEESHLVVKELWEIAT